MVLEELYKLKIAALLHDPPSKPFMLKEHERKARELATTLFEGEVDNLIHDERVKLADIVASSFDRWILSILMGGGWIPRLFKYETIMVKNIITPTLGKEIPRDIFARRNDLYDNYIGKLGGVVNASNEWGLRYHLLYLFYEALWLLNGLPCGPADTRVPTHSVFDHNYATAAMINWVFRDPKRVRGLLVGLDVPGVQEFIASSRKVRDTWISSYLVSALMWYAVVELVNKLGPDALLIPSLRMNVFYLYWLKSKFEGAQGREVFNEHIEEIEKLFYISDKVLEMFKGLGIPPYPVIPGRATLVLPPEEELRELINVENLEEYFIERFRRGWELLWKAAKKFAERKIQTEKEGEGFIWSFIKKAFDYYDKVFGDVGFDKSPPLGLRVERVEINASGDDENLWLLYDDKYRELVSKLSLAKYRRERPETRLGLYDATKRLFEDEALGFPKTSNRGFEYCTSCGRLPAIVVLPARESERPEENEYGLLLYCVVKKNGAPHVYSEKLEKKDEFEKLVSEFSDWFSRSRDQLESFKLVFSSGEKLCPWCFLKRVLSLEPRLLKILLIGGDENSIDRVIDGIVKEYGKERTWFPSLAHIASARLYEKVACLDPHKFKELITEELSKLITAYKPTPIGTWVWYFMQRTYDEMLGKAKSLVALGDERGLAELLIGILILTRSDPESFWFNPDRRSDWDRVLGKFGLSEWCWRYYALVRADGDSIGDLLEGKLTAFLAGKIDKYVYDEALVEAHLEEHEKRKLACFLHKYIVGSCEGPFREFMRFCLLAAQEGIEPSIDEKYEYARRMVEEGGVNIDDAHKRIDRVIEILRKVVATAPRVIVSPSYHVAVSAALMRVAILDITMISELDGVVVYAGGDDLMAFVPVDKALDVVLNTRKGYAGAPVEVKLGNRDVRVNLGDGFLQINDAYLPLLPSVGRSYCIYIAHYHYPLSVVIASSLRLLEDAKEKYSVEYYNGKYFDKAGKDVLVVAYNPRVAKEEYALIPLTVRRPIALMADEVLRVAYPLTFVKEVLKLMDEKFGGEGRAKLSHNLLYDVKESDYIRILTTLIKMVKGDSSRAKEAEDLSGRLMKEVVRRSSKLRSEAEKLSEELLEYFEKSSIPILSLVVERDKEIQPVILSAIDVARLIRSGVR